MHESEGAGLPASDPNATEVPLNPVAAGNAR
jgi:hypothetical protein